MKLKSNHILCIALLMLSFVVFMPVMASKYTVKARLDSTYLLMGKQTAVHLEIIGELDGSGRLLANDSMWCDVELVGMTEPEIKDLGNGRKELTRDMIIQAFDSGLYTLPPLIYIQGADSMEANKLVLKVLPVNVDTMLTVHDYADVASAGSKFFDFMPDWVTDYGLWILLALIVIGLSVFVYLKWLRKGKIPLIPVKKPIPPYQMAMQELQTLQSLQLCERGEEKEFYTRLTEILRKYLDGRFGINAMEMTSTEIRKAIRHNETTRMSESLMANVLETADFVKFAKVRPLPDDNISAFNSAVKFIEDTKPAPTEDEDKAKDAKEGEPNNKK
ncbi:MAG: hypothetical protein NC043_03515 [Muribaculaceae bacterium]|nr:hypothetical protein [Muribaculaceae bacterium]